MAHFGVELRRIQLALGAFHGRNGAHVGGGRHDKAFGHAAHGITVAHPDRLLVRRVAVKLACTRIAARQRSGAVFALLSVADLAAQGNGHNLLAIAETQHGNAKLENACIDRRRVFGVHACRPARQNNGRRSDLAHFVCRHIARHNLRVHVQIAHAPCNQLPVLGAKINNDNLLFGRCAGHEDPPSVAMSRHAGTPKRGKSPALFILHENECRCRSNMRAQQRYSA